MTSTTTPPDIHDTLGLTTRGRRRRIWRWVIAALVIAATAGIALRKSAAPAQAVSPYRTETVRKGALTVSVTATGELKPVTQVNIGTEISGIALSRARSSGCCNRKARATSVRTAMTRSSSRCGRCSAG